MDVPDARILFVNVRSRKPIIVGCDVCKTMIVNMTAALIIAKKTLIVQQIAITIFRQDNSNVLVR